MWPAIIAGGVLLALVWRGEQLDREARRGPQVAIGPIQDVRDFEDPFADDWGSDWFRRHRELNPHLGGGGVTLPVEPPQDT